MGEPAHDGLRPVPFITDAQARSMAAMMSQRAAVDPEFAEDIASINESLPYLIRYDGVPPPVLCECCGICVFAPLEADTRNGEPRTWTRAIWEAETGRKHTLRRCEWQRDHGSAARPSAVSL